MPSNIKDEFATIDLGDQRLDERLLRCAGRLAQDPCASLRAACKGEAEVKAGYRLLHNEKVDMEQILAAHRQAGLKRIGGCAQEEAILFIQDTTELDFTNHKALSGSGPLADLSLRGFYLHNHLLVSELGGVALALCSAKAWARKDEDHGKSKERRHLPMEQKESIRWLEGYEEACKLAGELPARQVIMVADRECDLFPLYSRWSQYCAAKEPCANFIVRALHDRKLSEGGFLFEALKGAPVLGAYEVEVDKKRQRIKIKGKNKSLTRTARTAELEVRSLEVSLIRPLKAEGLEAVQMSAVLVEEKSPPEGQRPIRWVLLSSLPAENFENARRIVRGYIRRWLIEDFHRILKSGCRVEALRLRESDALLPAVALYMVVAWRILYLRDLSRRCAEAPGLWFFTEGEWRALSLIFKLSPANSPPSLAKLTTLVARIGGYLARKSDPPPGAECLWRGMKKLRCYVEMGELLGAF